MSQFREEQCIMDQEAELHLLQERCKCLKAESGTQARKKEVWPRGVLQWLTINYG